MAFTEFCCRSGGSNMNGGALLAGACSIQLTGFRSANFQIHRAARPYR
jgi:hypothetical protein